MKIIKQDIKEFWKPTLLYILVTQILIYLFVKVSNITIGSGSQTLEYFTTFVIAMCVIIIIGYTMLFAIYYNTKANAIHLKKYQVTDGYGLYRFITTIGFILILTVNGLLGLQVNGIDVIKTILELHYYQLAALLFGLLPVLVLVIISIGHLHKRKIIRNIEGMVSLFAIFIGIYIAGNLYYFGNPQQGVAILFILFIPLAILFMSIKERNSQRSVYKIIVFILCMLVAIISVTLFATSDFEYTINSAEKYKPQLAVTTSNIESQKITSDYGQITYITDSSEANGISSIYQLTTDKYNYHVDVYGQSEVQFTANQLNSSNQVIISNGEYQTEAEITVNNYNIKTNQHKACTIPMSKIKNEKCDVDPEVIGVYQAIAANIEQVKN